MNVHNRSESSPNTTPPNSITQTAITIQNLTLPVPDDTGVAQPRFSKNSDNDIVAALFNQDEKVDRLRSQSPP